MSEEEIAKKIKYPKSAFLCLIMAYLWPMMFMSWYVVITKRISIDQLSPILCTPVMLIYEIIHICLSIAAITLTIKTLVHNDDKNDGLNKKNKTWLVINFGHIFYLVLTAFLYSFFFWKSGLKLGITTIHLPSYLMTWIGSTLMWDMFFYIIWLEITEKWMNFLPFTKENMALSMKLKFILVSSFSTVAMALLCMAPIIYPAYENLSQYQLFNKVLPMAILGVVLITIDFILLVHSSITNVKIFYKFAGKLAEGDYTQENLQVVSRDEYGLVVNNLNLFFNHTKSLLSNLQEAVQLSTTAADSSSNSMQNITESVSEIVQSISEVQKQMQSQSAGVEEAAAIINEIGNNISGLDNTIQKQVTAVEESSAAVHQMVANIQSVSNILDKNSGTTKELANASEEGRQSVQMAVSLSDKILEESKGLIEASNVVQNIASQTNLLAMNAAIEAAHAGESGKGFAVVADEIRKLAEQSNVQGKRITTSLKELETSIRGVSESTRSLNTKFENIFNLTEVVQQQESVVTNAMTEQAAGSNQIISAMQNIDAATQEVKRGSGQILEGSKQISIEMEALAKSTLETNNNILHVANGATVISEAVQAGNQASVQNTQSIDKIKEEISKFKL